MSYAIVICISSAFCWSFSRFAEFIMLIDAQPKKISFLAKIDGIYGIASIFVVGVGMAMWFGFDAGLGFKPTAWYMENPYFI